MPQIDTFSFLRNNLFTAYTLEVDFPKIYNFTAPKQEQNALNAFSSIQALYDKAKFQKQNEHQFEDDFIAKTLEILGWHFVRQDEKIIQGKLEKPDFLLFTTPESKQAYQNIDKEKRTASNEFIDVILESKAYSVEVDNGKVKDNPHFQLLRYLNNLRLNFGFLTNGRIWRFYNNEKLTANKVFYEINLEAILENTDTNQALKDFKYFYFIFQAHNFAQIDQADKEIKTTIHQTLSYNENAKIELENDLQSIIYGIEGKDSLFEFVGSTLFRANPQANLQEIYENSLYFIFRMLFIAYFEDKFDELLSLHSCFKKELSLQTLLINLDEEEQSFSGIVKLNQIFRIYDKGEPNYDMPVFNGGLFDESKAPLLLTPKIFNNKDLRYILHQFLFYNNKNSLFKRDYKTLNVAHLGTIYEGLLSYFFERADENLVYVIYSDKRSGKNTAKSMEGYFDSYDYKNLEKVYKIQRIQNYQKGQIYLKNTSNSRKSTASFYTPDTITKFLVENALKDTLTNDNITHFKILDNACGSGHFLVESLNQITQIISQDFDSFPKLKELFLAEKQSIEANISKYIKDYTADENDILKRLLLKRVIFGVDLNPFSIELTKLSLWIDSFIFGTPLSFIEHHIKQGNALIGTSIAEFKQYFEAHQKKESSLFVSDFLDIFSELSSVFALLDSITDTTQNDILESKRIYKEQIKPKLDNLNMYLNFITAKSFCDSKELQILKSGEVSINEILEIKYKDLQEIILKYAKKLSFFNYEIEFPEITANSSFAGFQAIVGNPPWDKIKFSDSDFFPQYRSDYRTLSNSGKKEVQENLLAKSYIKKQYEETKALITAQNEYYKAHFPLNRGSGDGNLFRFLVERNLSLLAHNASLNYVLPSALMLEKGSYALRKEILENKSLIYFYAFQNRKWLFSSVADNYKFALMQIVNAKSEPKHTIKTMFYKTTIDEVYNKNNIITTTLQDIKTLSPNQLAFQEVRSQEDLEILKKCYAAFAPLDLQWLDFRRELDTTIDKDLFIESPNALKGGGALSTL
ncbi:Eco57I restriction-modification methylase domain-containing protein [Campylobacter sp. MIT 97-5078]|uniref:Eco57I restriction-modification methylase domain-containing protein n=1 Tax=Campylobacter sp. MIT 97-5078 TaxID=1548153 RepID=UPI000AA8132B|nr:N-6 DNA methylase [Campylobacter sp. MIT 97-5078]